MLEEVPQDRRKEYQEAFEMFDVNKDGTISKKELEFILRSLNEDPEEDEIDDFASIVAIADVYDAMTTARAHRDPLCSFQVISEFEKEGLQTFNTKYILTFLERIANTYNNSRVILNNAKTGRVVYINKSSLSRPVVQLDNGEIINLADNAFSDIYIKSIL